MTISFHSSRALIVSTTLSLSTGNLKLKSELVLQVYDSVIAESPDEEVEEVAHIIKDIMENVNKPFDIINRVKLLADVEVGPNLADLKKIL